MIGAIIGDMVGSIYEFHPIKSKEFNIYNKNMEMTDDSYLTIAVAKVLMNNYPIDYNNLEKIKKELVNEFVQTVMKYPNAGYGGRFGKWARNAYYYNECAPYNSCGNGSAMRISPVGFISNSIEEVKKLSKAVSEITHNHPEGIKGAESVAMCIYLARIGKTKEEIKEYVINNYYPEIKDYDFDDLVKNYEFVEICQESCPQAIYCFLISNSFEDAIRNCIAIGGDCDTTGAMAGAIAEAYYWKDGIDEFGKKFINDMIDKDVIELNDKFNEMIK